MVLHGVGVFVLGSCFHSSFASKFSISEVLLLESVYYIAVVILEVPSGYVSDRMGRRPTLMAAAALLGLSYILFFLGDSFFVLLWPKC